MAPASVETFTVIGMTCGHCVASVTEELTALPGVTGVDVDLESGRVTVASTAPLDRQQVTAAVEEVGFRL
jgi:copper chaperone